MSKMLLILLVCVFILQNIYSKNDFLGENNRSHLKFKHIIELCNNRSVCVSNATRLCAVRMVNFSAEYQSFENSCFLFLSNMCDFPGEEFNIIEGITCAVYFAERRSQRRSETANGTVEYKNPTNSTGDNNTEHEPTEPGALRGGVSLLYEVETAFDEHICPLSCPDTYSPVCLSANRGAGKYFRFFTFVNHCLGDVYYCKNYDEFAAPPDAEGEDVNISPLGWSYCGAFRYVQFARSSEVISSMGHYGWLAGDQRYSRVLDPRERRPGYG